jgi:hypothetical protein
MGGREQSKKREPREERTLGCSPGSSDSINAVAALLLRIGYKGGASLLTAPPRRVVVVPTVVGELDPPSPANFDSADLVVVAVGARVGCLLATGRVARLAVARTVVQNNHFHRWHKDQAKKKGWSGLPPGPACTCDPGMDLRSGHGRAVNYAFFAHCPARITRTITPAGSTRIPPGPMPRTIPDKGCAPTRLPQAPEKGILNRSLSGQEEGPLPDWQVVCPPPPHPRAARYLEASVASRQTFTWLNAVYLRVFRSHLQV